MAGNELEKDGSIPPAVVEPVLEDLSFEGFLRKRKDTMRFTWARYWFKLQNTTLYFYMSPDTALLRGQYYMFHVQSVRKLNRSTADFQFEIVMKNGKKKILSADTAELRDVWIAFLWKAMQLPGPGRKKSSCTWFDIPNLLEKAQTGSTDSNNSGSYTENAQDGAPAENAQDGTPTENAQDGTPTENAQDGAPTDNAQDGVPTENAQDGAPTENAPLPALQPDRHSDNEGTDDLNDALECNDFTTSSDQGQINGSISPPLPEHDCVKRSESEAHIYDVPRRIIMAAAAAASGGQVTADGTETETADPILSQNDPQTS